MLLGPACTLVPPALASLAEVKIDFVPRQGESRAPECCLPHPARVSSPLNRSREPGVGTWLSLRPSLSPATLTAGQLRSISACFLTSKTGTPKWLPNGVMGTTTYGGMRELAEDITVVGFIILFCF